jgi:cytochrome o ubiquinol oxidase subunit 2
MIYAMPGMVSQLHLQADSPGQLWGTSAQFSGDGFSDMQFPVRSVSPADFAAWTASARSAGPALDRAAYARLLQQSQRDPPSTFRAVDPNLFQAIATQKIAPGPGPTLGPQPGAPQHAGREIAPGGRN